VTTDVHVKAKSTWGMSWRQEARKGVRRLRNARRSCQTSVDAGVPESARAESIGARGEPRPKGPPGA
jgi:hypothetical protein